MDEASFLTIRNRDKLFIGGEWVAPASPATIRIVSPNSEQVVSEVAEGGNADMDRAVAAARDAFDHGPWPRMAVAERVAAIRRMVEHLRGREPELAAAWTLQMGGLSTMAPGMASGGTMTFEGYAAMAEKFPFEQRVETPMNPAAFILREPVGVVAAIAPWNAPYSIMAGKVAPALASGCTVIMKPSPETPLEAYIIAEAAEAAGLPPGVLNLVVSHREAAHHLVSNPGVDKVSFTGSTAAGRMIASTCGERIARCTLELGGKSAVVVLDDYSTPDAAKLLAGTITMLSGQVCAMLSRAIVPRKRHDELADAIAAEMKQTRIGYSDAPETQLGPLAMERQRDRVEHYIELGKSAGADLVTGGGRPAHLNRGFFIEPTLFANVTSDMQIAQDEIFGPVLSLMPCEDEEDAIRIANESIYGLNGSVLTHDNDAAYRVGKQVRTGGFGQNGMRLDFTLPFGGYKQSGLGREGGQEGLLAYTEMKTMLLDGAPSHLAA